MRINIYSQEMLLSPGCLSTELVEKEADTGITYSAVRMYLRSPDELHFTEEDDDRSAITFWLPKSKSRRLMLAQILHRLGDYCVSARSETGLD